MTKIIASVLFVTASIAAASDLLWYRQEAANWNEALPIGNGRLGGMVFGGVQSDRIQLNEDTVWAGEKRDRNNPEAAKNLAEVRRLLFAGNHRRVGRWLEARGQLQSCRGSPLCSGIGHT